MLGKYSQLRKMNLLSVDRQQFIKRQKIKYNSSFSKKLNNRTQNIKTNNKLCWNQLLKVKM